MPSYLNVFVSIFLPLALTQKVIRSDSYFYGESPSAGNAPVALGTAGWETSYEKARLFVSQLTLEEKVNLTAGVTPTTGCSGSIPPIERLGFPGLCLSDGPTGVRNTDLVNAYASGVHIGSSWNKALAAKAARHMANEFRVKGVNIFLGPVIGPLGRVVTGGRAWEGYSVDPYLSGILVGEAIRGIQSTGVIAGPKHLIANEQEFHRNPVITSKGKVESISSNIDDRTMHETYLWPFADAVHAGAANIMCSYNRINNSYGCQNSKVLSGLLKDELGFQGFVVSDWGAQKSGVASALAGLDMAMPSNALWGGNLTLAVQNGSVPEYRIDDMATRIIASWYQTGQDVEGYPHPGIGLPPNLLEAHTPVNAKDPRSKGARLRQAIEGHVLVKNIRGALPLRQPQQLSLFGYDGIAPRTFDSKGALPALTANNLTPANIDQLIAALGFGLGFESADFATAFCAFTGPLIDCPPFLPAAYNGTIIAGGGSGANTPAYYNAPFDAIQQRASSDGTSLFWDFVNTNSTGEVAAGSDACLVFLNSFAAEGLDRPALRDDFSDGLVLDIASKCNNTIVVIHNAGVRLVDQWIDHPNVTAVLYAHLPGQDSGRALVNILYGDTSPSGRLPYTVAKNESDYEHLLWHDVPQGRFKYFPQSDFTEGSLIDYHHFDAKNITPRFEFGFRLTYSEFEYSKLSVESLYKHGFGKYPTSKIVSGGHEDLFDIVATVNATITNIGDAEAAEVSQLYITLPSENFKRLRGFNKNKIPPGQSIEVTFDIRRRDLSIWDTEQQAWLLQAGGYVVEVGASSRNLALKDELVVY